MSGLLASLRQMARDLGVTLAPMSVDAKGEVLVQAETSFGATLAGHLNLHNPKTRSGQRTTLAGKSNACRVHYSELDLMLREYTEQF